MKMTLISEERLACLDDMLSATSRLMIFLRDGQCELGCRDPEIVEDVRNSVGEIQKALAYLQYHDDNVQNN
jgi:hypothetical protein